jgi:hypothetical protein
MLPSPSGNTSADASAARDSLRSLDSAFDGKIGRNPFSTIKFYHEDGATMASTPEPPTRKLVVRMFPDNLACRVFLMCARALCNQNPWIAKGDSPGPVVNAGFG